MTLPGEATAWSVDGRTTGGTVPLAHPSVPGDVVVLTTAEGDRILTRVLAKEPLDGDSVAAPTRARITGTVMGRFVDGAFAPGAAEPFEGAAVALAGPDDLTAALDALDHGRATAVVGHVRVHGTRLPARVRLSGFNRHTFVCGQSGSGKTYSLGVLLERVLTGTDLRLVILDPNGDYTRLDALGESAPTASTDEGAAEIDRLRRRHAEVAASVAIRSGTGEAAPTARMLDLDPATQALLLRLDPVADRAEFSDAVDLLVRLRKLRAEGATLDRSGDAMEALRTAAEQLSPELALRLKNLGVLGWDIWSRDRTPVIDLVAGGARATVADLGSIASDAERNALTLAVLEQLWARRHERVPTMIVIDEAHTVVPAVAADPVQDRCRELVVRIAGEGRKFGLFLVLATQRPDKIDANAMSQCDNLVLMRMNAAADVHALQEIFSFVPRALVAQSTGFAQGDAVLAGPIVHGPSRITFEGRCTQEGGSDLPTDWARGFAAD
jgi:DNA helicase HerA-like ATPase